MTKKQKKKDNGLMLAIIAMAILLFSIVTIFKLGIVGVYLNNFIHYLFGDAFIVPFLCVSLVLVYSLLIKDVIKSNLKFIIGLISINVAIILFVATFNANTTGFDEFGTYFANTIDLLNGKLPFTGGLLGFLLYGLFSILFDKIGTYLVAGFILIVGLILAIKKETYISLYNNAKTKTKKAHENHELKKLKKIQVNKQKEETKKIKPINVDENKENKKSIFITYDQNKNTNNAKEIKQDKIEENKTVVTSTPTTNYDNYVLPNLSILDKEVVKSKNNINETSAKIKGNKVIEILDNFGIKAELLATHIGPSVTKFELKPDSSVKVNKIHNISDNIKMELAARDIRIEAPIPGRSAVGIEIPNVESVPVKMIELIKNVPANKQNNPLLIALGKDLMGTPVFCELNKMPHLLVAGATGSGKSVCMNSIITSILLRATPNEVKLLLVDPKKVEFTPYHNVPHLIGPVISDASEANNALKVIVNMMEARFDIFAKAGVRNIKGFNDKIEADKDTKLKKMPYIVVIIDELADLMALCGKEVEMSIQRITQLARASGIHLIVATQRPSTDVITGIIKSNIPSRIAFSVASGIDSRTIIDSVGAERLLGNGDMLYLPIGEPSCIRLQGTYVTDNEVKRITDYVKTQGIPLYDDAFIRLEGLQTEEDNAVLRANDDPLYDEVKEFVIDQQKASTSLLQRRFGIGYNRAARMIDVLEENGIIGPAQGSKPRDVYIKKNKENEIDE